MNSLFIAPKNYITGFNIIGEIGKKIKHKRVVVLGNENVFEITSAIFESFSKNGIEFKKIEFKKECSHTEMNRVLLEITEFNATAVIGVGGGKVLDTAKGAGYKAGVEIITIPTIAATCAAWSSHSAVYTDGGIALEYMSIGKNPDIVFVDKKIISQAPVRYLIAGIGDTIAKWIETEASTRSIKNKSVETEIAIMLAKKCYEEILKFGEKAVADNKNKTFSKELDIVINHVIFTAGLIGGIGGESCRAVASHAVNNGFTVLPERYSKNLHGEVVAFGNLVQLILDKRVEEKIKQLVQFYKKIGIGCSLKEMGFDQLSAKEMESIVNKALYKGDTISNLPYVVTFETLKNAIEYADKLAGK